MHALTDGRDVEDGSSVHFISQLKADLEELEKKHSGLDAKIASGGGRMRVTMDRYEVSMLLDMAGLTCSCVLDCDCCHNRKRIKDRNLQDACSFMDS